MENPRQPIAPFQPLVNLAATSGTIKLADVYEAAMHTWGLAEQCSMFSEESGEALAASNQHRRGRVDDDKLAEELADLDIMLGQMRLRVSSVLFDKWKSIKVRRLRERILDANRTSQD